MIRRGDVVSPRVEDESDEREQEELPPSRTELTRAAAEVNHLAIELTRLSAEDLDRLELPERVREEVDVCIGLKPKSRGRQNRLIGQLLRAEDHEAIRARFEDLARLHRFDVQQEKRNEQWLARLLEEGDAAVEALIAEVPDLDRQQLRTLTRTARKLANGPRAKKSRRELLRAIRAARA